jgi:tyrosine-protein kinase Etk/Wzc
VRLVKEEYNHQLIMNILTYKKEKKEENLVSLIRFRFVPYWPLFVLLLVLSGIGAWMYLKTVTPIYSASASIVIKDEKKGTDDSKLLESLNISSAKKIVENEIEVIQSRDLMKKVVTRLNLYAPLYEKEKFKNVTAYTSSPVRIEAKDPDQLSGTKPVFFTYNNAEAAVQIEKARYPLNSWVNTPYGVLKFSKNPQFQQAAKGDLFFTLNKPINVAGGLVQNLSIATSSKSSTVIDLTYADESPVRAQDVLNELINTYTKYNIEEKNSVAASAVVFIEDRLKNVVKELDSIERSLQNYKSTRGIVDLSEQGKQFLQNVGDNDRKVGDISAQLAMLNQVENYVVKKGETAGMVPSTVGLGDPGLAGLLERLNENELKYESMKKTVGENNPSVAAVAKEIEQLRPAVLENIRNQQKSLEASRRNLNSTNGMYSSVLRTIPQQERVLLDMSRQQSIKSGVYSFLLQKREEAVLSSSSSVADSRVLDSAVASSSPVSPKKLQIYTLALILAFILGIGIVSAKEFFSNKILFRSEIETMTTFPIAGEITSVKHKDELVIVDPKKLFMAEQFRQLRASIGLYSKDDRKKKLMITSSISGEGKSFIASNLGLSLAMSGKKVVLIDFDVRSPKTSRTFGLQQGKGLAEYLDGKTAIEKIINKIEIEQSGYSNLFIIPAGRSEVNPTELLQSEKILELFSYLEDHFDFILVDTSPVDAVIDAFVLSEYCDKTLFVVRHGYTPKTIVQLFDKNSKVKSLKNLSIVFNSIKPRGFVKNTYGYGYGYGYSNVYSSKYTEPT